MRLQYRPFTICHCRVWRTVRQYKKKKIYTNRPFKSVTLYSYYLLLVSCQHFRHFMIFPMKIFNLIVAIGDSFSSIFHNFARKWIQQSIKLHIFAFFVR